MEEILWTLIIAYAAVGMILTAASFIPQIKDMSWKRLPTAVWMAVGYVVAWLPITIRIWWRADE